MDTTIRNLDPEAYRSLKAYAALRGVTIGEALSEIILAHVTHPAARPKKYKLTDLPIFDTPGTENVVDEIDKIVYGI